MNKQDIAQNLRHVHSLDGKVEVVSTLIEAAVAEEREKASFDAACFRYLRAVWDAEPLSAADWVSIAEDAIRAGEPAAPAPFEERILTEEEGRMLDAAWEAHKAAAPAPAVQWTDAQIEAARISLDARKGYGITAEHVRAALEAASGEAK
jgi:hypothetical protein